MYGASIIRTTNLINVAIKRNMCSVHVIHFSSEFLMFMPHDTTIFLPQFCTCCSLFAERISTLMCHRQYHLHWPEIIFCLRMGVAEFYSYVYRYWVKLLLGINLLLIKTMWIFI